MSYADTQPGPDGWGPPRRHGDHPQGQGLEFSSVFVPLATKRVRHERF